MCLLYVSSPHAGVSWFSWRRVSMGVRIGRGSNPGANPVVACPRDGSHSLSIRGHVGLFFFLSRRGLGGEFEGNQHPSIQADPLGDTSAGNRRKAADLRVHGDAGFGRADHFERLLDAGHEVLPSTTQPPRPGGPRTSLSAVTGHSRGGGTWRGGFRCARLRSSDEGGARRKLRGRSRSIGPAGLVAPPPPSPQLRLISAARSARRRGPAA